MPRLSQRTFDRYRDALTLAHRRYEAEAEPITTQMCAYFLGDHWRGPAGVAPGALPQVTANLIFADVKVMLPVLALRNPKVFVKPTTATVQAPTATQTGQEMQPVQIVNNKPVRVLEVARAKEALINWRWRQLRLVKQVRRCLVDALLSPFAVMKVGYTMATEKVDLGAQDPELLEVNDLITAEAPYATRWSPRDFRVDPEARYPDLSDAGWVAFGWMARLEDVKRNPRFKNTRDLTATVELKQDWTAQGVTGRRPVLGERASDEDQRRVQLWEIWDKRRQVRIVLADDHDKSLEFIDWPQAYTGFPCETLVFTEHPEQLYGPPDLKQILGQQDAYNQINSMVLNHTRRFMRKYITTRGAFDDKEMLKLMEPIDGLVVETDGNAKESIVPLQDANIPVDWWQTRANFREDHDRVSGVADFVRGVAEKVDTATEAAALQANLNVRTNDTRATVEDFAERISSKLLAIDAQTINLPASIPVIGPDGALAMREWIHVQTRETLLAETDCEIEIGSMQPINESVRKRDAMELFGALKGDPLTNQFKLRQLLVPAYREHVPEVGMLFYSRDEFEALQMRQMQMAQAAGAPPGGPGGPGRPPGGPPRPMGARPAGPRPAPPSSSRPPGIAAPGGSGPRPVPGPVDQEV